MKLSYVWYKHFGIVIVGKLALVSYVIMKVPHDTSVSQSQDKAAPIRFSIAKNAFILIVFTSVISNNYGDLF